MERWVWWDLVGESPNNDSNPTIQLINKKNTKEARATYTKLIDFLYIIYNSIIKGFLIRARSTFTSKQTLLHAI